MPANIDTERALLRHPTQVCARTTPVPRAGYRRGLGLGDAAAASLVKVVAITPAGLTFLDDSNSSSFWVRV